MSKSPPNDPHRPDITRKGCHLWAVGEGRALIECAFHCTLRDEGAFLVGCMSRKKKIVPVVETVFAAVKAARVKIGESILYHLRRRANHFRSSSTQSTLLPMRPSRKKSASGMGTVWKT